jgi:hypothetical protein
LSGNRSRKGKNGLEDILKIRRNSMFKNNLCASWRVLTLKASPGAWKPFLEVQK